MSILLYAKIIVFFQTLIRNIDMNITFSNQ